MQSSHSQFRIFEYKPEMLPSLRLMYEGFQPRGAAKGLPPVWDQALASWLHFVTSKYINLIALHDQTDSHAAGHAMIAPTKDTEAELALFVHQDFRRQGLGTRLVRESVVRARQSGYRRLWAAVDIERPYILSMMERAGFRLLSPVDEPDYEMELLLDSKIG